MQILWIIIAIISSYLIGAIPFGYIILTLKASILREHGK